MKKFWKIAGWSVFISAYGIYALWCFGAICYAPLPFLLRIVCAVLFSLLILTAPLLKPRLLFAAGGLLLMVGVSAFWSMIQPTDNRDWLPQYKYLPRFEWHDENHFTLHNLRDFHYRTSEEDYNARYRTEKYDLRDLTALEYILVHWENPLGMKIAHTMLCFRFKKAPNLVFSCETRRAKGDPAGGLPGFYKQFNLIYIAGTETDLIAVRTNYRNPREDVYLYQTNATKEQREAIFRDLTARANALTRKPEFYNTISSNCITSLLPSIRIGVEIPWHNRAYLLNGLSDKLALKLGFLTKASDSETWEELRKRSHVNPRTQSLNEDLKNFSTIIRQHEVPHRP